MSFVVLDSFLTMSWFFIRILWIFLVIWIIINIFGSRDLSGWAKAGWLILVILLPFLGVFVYLVARGAAWPNGRSQRLTAPRDEAYRVYARDEAERKGSAEELTKLADLRYRGVITDPGIPAEQGQAARLIAHTRAQPERR